MKWEKYWVTSVQGFLERDRADKELLSDRLGGVYIVVGLHLHLSQASFYPELNYNLNINKRK